MAITKIRIYELAKVVGLENKALLGVVTDDLGIEAKGSQSGLTRAQVDKVCAHLKSPETTRAEALALFDGKTGKGGTTRSAPSRSSAAKSGGDDSAVRRRSPVVMRRRGSGTRPSERDEDELPGAGGAGSASRPRAAWSSARAT